MIVFESIKSFFKKLKSHLNSTVAFVAVILISVGALLFQYFGREDSVSPLTIAGTVVVPFQEGINEIGGFLFKSEKEKISLDEAKDKIAELQAEIDALKRENLSLNSLVLENAELRRLLGAKERLSSYEMTEASVIGNDGTNVFMRLTINKGSMDGIRVNMNVITAEGLVGLVTKVGLNYSVVTTVIEDGVNVSVMTRNGHETCIATGDYSLSGASYMKLDNALSSIDFSGDSMLLTSYISDKYLPGLVVGYATDFKVNPEGLTQSGRVRTAVDFTNLREVMVITTMKEELKEGEK